MPARMGNIKQETLNGAKWAMIDKCVMQPANFLYFMVLARLITPDEMGILGLTGVFFALTNSLKEAGLGTALIRKQNRTEVDCSTVFWFNIVANMLVALLFWLIAPWFASFFNVPDLKWITRISCIMMVLGATQSVHYTLYAARRDFKTTTIISIVSTLLGMPVTLYLAYTGWSYWSLVISGVFTGLLSLVIVWIVSPWKPLFVFSGKSFKEFFAFGFKLSLAGCVWNVYTEIVNFVIGKFYSPAQLALYGRANHLVKLPESILFQPISGIMYPILSTIQDDEERLNRVYRKYLRLCLMPMMWIMFSLAASASSIVHLLYGTAWLPSAPYLQILCVGYSLVPLVLVNRSYLSVKGRSDLLLKREINVRLVGLVLMLGAATQSVAAICWAYTAFSLYNTIVTTAYTKSVSNMSVLEQMKDFLPYLMIAAAVNLPAVLICWLGVPYYICAFAGPAISLVLYVSIMHIRRDDAYIMLRDTVWNCKPIRMIRARLSA